MPPRSDLLDPIPGDNPAGVHLRHEALFDQIREARRSDDDGTRRPEDPPPKAADWVREYELASEALATRSKDLELAGWLAEALLRREGFAGLTVGLDVIQGLITRYWDTLYPSLVEDDEDDPAADRAARLSWVGRYLVPGVEDAPLNRKGLGLLKYRESRRVGSEAECAGDEKKLEARQQAIDEGKIPAEEFDRAFDETPKTWYKALLADVKAARASLGALDTLAKGRIPVDPPDFAPLQQVLADAERVAQSLLVRKLELDPDPVEESAPAEDDAADEAEPADGMPVEPRSTDDAWKRVATIAHYLRAQLPGNPGPYLMLRGLRWGELRTTGGEVNPKALAAPPTNVRSRLKGFMLDGRWRELLEACETVMTRPDGRGWLDLQRYAVTACDNLGGEYEAVGRAIRGELSLLLKDVPGLPAMTLMDDTPTANAETQQWMREQGIWGTEDEGGDGAAPAIAPTRQAPARVVFDAVFSRAKDAIRAGDVKHAIEILSAEVARERSPRARFLRQVQIASVMVDSGHEALAKPILEEALNQVEAHSLEQWEAQDLVAQPLVLLLRCLRKLDLDADRREEIYLRIARLDPIQALSLES